MSFIIFRVFCEKHGWLKRILYGTIIIVGCKVRTFSLQNSSSSPTDNLRIVDEQVAPRGPNGHIASSLFEHSVASKTPSKPLVQDNLDPDTLRSIKLYQFKRDIALCPSHIREGFRNEPAYTKYEGLVVYYDNGLRGPTLLQDIDVSLQLLDDLLNKVIELNRLEVAYDLLEEKLEEAKRNIWIDLADHQKDKVFDVERNQREVLKSYKHIKKINNYSIDNELKARKECIAAQEKMKKLIEEYQEFASKL